MPFTPKFVDLVRNYTSIQGSGAVTLGQPVSGYTSFAAACVTGDQFYYCIQGVDKPGEREVGRGTMQANGSIARDPVGGVATNFSKGAKTISLVTAAEWFAKVEAAAGGSSVASRALLAGQVGPTGRVVTLGEAGRAGLFRFDPANLAARVAADGTQAIHVPPQGQDGASGAWVRQFDGAVNVRWFGATGDGVSDDSTAFVAAIAYLRSTKLAGNFGYGSGSGDLFVPAGHYFLGTTTLDLSHTMRIVGESMGHTGGSSTVLRWAAGATGIRVQAHNTTGATGVIASPPDIVSGKGSTIEKLHLRGGYAGVEGEFHGIHLRGMATIKQVYVDKFQGDGIFAHAVAGSGGAVEGNANLTRVEDVTVQECRNGVFMDSADTNACTFINGNFIANRMWGVWDSSFLGNNYFGCHVAGNGWDGALGSVPTACSLGGNRYYVRPGQAAGASTNAPTGTTASNTWWGYIGAGGTYNGIVAWVSGTTFREGGSYKTDDPNARNMFVGCYAESDSNPAQVAPTSVIIGGLLDNHGNSYQLTTDSVGDIRLGRRFGSANDSTVYIDNANYGSILVGRRFDAGVGTEIARLWMSYGNGTIYDVNNAGWAHIFRVAGANKARLDATGFRLSGDGAALGYATGAGGAALQATSKSTGVTLNKVCGQVAMNAASLAADTAVSFTLTNSQIAATDVVNVSIGSGASAGAYAVGIDQVAAGSCRVSLRNLTAAALAEAVVLNIAVVKAVAA